MTATNDLERRVAEFYAAEAPHRAPDRVLAQTLTTIDHTRQRRELRLVPWRTPPMNIYAKLAVAAAVVIAVGAIGLTILQPGPGALVGGPGSSSSPAPSASPSPSPSPSPSLSPALTPAPLTGSYTSAVHGLSVSYPEGWQVAPATTAEATVDVNWLQPGNDFLYDPVRESGLFFVLGSYALDGEAGEAWATGALDADPDCNSAGESSTVDGEPALRCGTLALTWAGNRGYSIKLYSSDDDPAANAAYDDAWFDDLLATVQLP
jgi:hypothetical protein